MKNIQKELVIKDLLLGFGKFFHEGGADLVPADLQYFSRTGLPKADRALLKGAPLCIPDDTEDVDEDAETKSNHKRKDGNKTIHGQPRWPPNTEISGNCSRRVRMDDAGRVDLQHDPYCLRTHFTTLWAVLKDQKVTGPPQRGCAVEWDDWRLSFEAEHTDTPYPRLIDLISSPLLLYRITASFAAPPCTEDDVYKCAWSFTLWNRDDPTCSLEIYEHKGWPQAYFRGGGQASTEALQLLEWLAGENCPHSYDYTPAGRHA